MIPRLTRVQLRSRPGTGCTAHYTPSSHQFPPDLILLPVVLAAVVLVMLVIVVEATLRFFEPCRASRSSSSLPAPLFTPHDVPDPERAETDTSDSDSPFLRCLSVVANPNEFLAFLFDFVVTPSSPAVPIPLSTPDPNPVPPISRSNHSSSSSLTSKVPPIAPVFGSVETGTEGAVVCSDCAFHSLFLRCLLLSPSPPPSPFPFTFTSTSPSVAAVAVVEVEVAPETRAAEGALDLDDCGPPDSHVGL